MTSGQVRAGGGEEIERKGRSVFKVRTGGARARVVEGRRGCGRGSPGVSNNGAGGSGDGVCEGVNVEGPMSSTKGVVKNI